MKHSSSEMIAEGLKAIHQKSADTIERMAAELKKKDALIEKYKTALEFYSGLADEVYEVKVTSYKQVGRDEADLVTIDDGEMARQALAESESK